MGNNESIDAKCSARFALLKELGVYEPSDRILSTTEFCLLAQLNGSLKSSITSLMQQADLLNIVNMIAVGMHRPQ
jgi:hypothetical protein